jgi:hypothetical protein
MSAASITQSAGRINGIFDVSQLAQASIPEGAVLAYQTSSTDDNDAILPGAANAQGLCGISTSAGSIPGGTATSGSDFVLVQKVGRAKVLLAASTTVARGQLCVVANSSGHCTARTQWSSTAEALGWFAQSHTSGSSAEFVSVDLSMHTIETCMPCFGSASTAIVAATKYLGSAGTTTAGRAQIVLGVCARAAVLRNLACSTSTAPAGSDTAISVVQKSSDNGGTWSDTTLTATITGTAKAAQDYTHAPTVAAGDLLAIKVTSSGTTAAGCAAQFSIT